LDSIFSSMKNQRRTEAQSAHLKYFLINLGDQPKSGCSLSDQSTGYKQQDYVTSKRDHSQYRLENRLISKNRKHIYWYVPSHGHWSPFTYISSSQSLSRSMAHKLKRYINDVLDMLWKEWYNRTDIEDSSIRRTRIAQNGIVVVLRMTSTIKLVRLDIPMHHVIIWCDYVSHH